MVNAALVSLLWVFVGKSSDTSPDLVSRICPYRVFRIRIARSSHRPGHPPPQGGGRRTVFSQCLATGHLFVSLFGIKAFYRLRSLGFFFLEPVAIELATNLVQTSCIRDFAQVSMAHAGCCPSCEYILHDIDNHFLIAGRYKGLLMWISNI